MGVIAPAKSFQLPIVRQPHRCSLPDLGWWEGNDDCQEPPGKLWKGEGQFSRPGSTSRRHPLTAMTTISAPLWIPDSRCAVAGQRAPSTSTTPSGETSVIARPLFPTRPSRPMVFVENRARPMVGIASK